MPVSDAEYAHNCLFVKQNKESKKLQIRLRPWLQQDQYTGAVTRRSQRSAWTPIAVDAVWRSNSRVQDQVWFEFIFVYGWAV